MSVSLEVYVERHCFTCRYSADLVTKLKAEFPEVHVDLIDLEEDGGVYRDLVVAVPTFILNGHVFSLGNPAPAELRSEIQQLLAGVDV